MNAKLLKLITALTFAGVVAYIVIMASGCGTVAPKAVYADVRAIDSHGQPTGGLWGVYTLNGIIGVKVDPELVVPNYAAWQPVFGSLCSPPAKPWGQVFTLLPDKSYWCDDPTWLNYEDMRHRFNQVQPIAK